VLEVWHALLERGFRRMVKRRKELEHPFVTHHLGTLGTGNHFLEVCIQLDTDEADPPIWLMLHSGSRGVGNRIGTWFTKQARAATLDAGIKLADPELGFLSSGTELFDDYLADAQWAQEYAWQNRLLMFRHALDGIAAALGASAIGCDDARLVQCHHNYVAREEHFGRAGWLTRKGAVNADTGVMGIIPGSMGAQSYITRGKGNPEALKTSSHGAGRVMSRNVARRSITLEEHLAALEGVECRTDPDVIDESPACYKPIEAVMAAQANLTEPVSTLKQIVVVKG
jgi:tRNA-splicing ligase RtcB